MKAALAVLLGLFVATASLPAQALRCDGLQAHESRGGHVLARHVGKDLAFLQRRIRNEGVSAASSFRTRADAERLVAAALAASQRRLQNWLRSSRARLAFSWNAREVSGDSLRRGQSALRPVHSVKLVLQHDRAMECGFHLVTAYPEPP